MAVSVIIAAHNEGSQIIAKLEDCVALLEMNPTNEVIVVSDHSTDETLAKARAFRNPRVSVIENACARGRAMAHNFATPFARNEIVLYTDVETRVPADTVKRMLGAFADPVVGCVNAEIAFEQTSDEVTRSAGLYWQFENWLRTSETDLGIYMTSSGPCMAIRKALFERLPPAGDVDFTTPLDVIDQGYRCVHLADALAFDVMPPNAASEFNARARMVAKNLPGTVIRWGVRNIIAHPFVSFAIYSHKVLRWCLPVFLIFAFVSNIFLLASGWVYDVAFLSQCIAYCFAALGRIAYRKRVHWSFAQQVYAFVLINCAFLLGITTAVMGKAPTFYSPVRRSHSR